MMNEAKQEVELQARDPLSNHYAVGGIEVIDVIKAKLTPEQFEGYLIGSSIEYLLRANHKGQKDRDYQKAANFTKWLNDYNVERLAIAAADDMVEAEKIAKIPTMEDYDNPSIRQGFNNPAEKT